MTLRRKKTTTDASRERVNGGRFNRAMAGRGGVRLRRRLREVCRVLETDGRRGQLQQRGKLPRKSTR
jgi:hypothetical protein